MDYLIEIKKKFNIFNRRLCNKSSNIEDSIYLYFIANKLNFNFINFIKCI